jgi:hypothetical protein
MQYRYVEVTPYEYNFPYNPEDYVTIVVRFLVKKRQESFIYYHGVITAVDVEKRGFWTRLESDRPFTKFFGYMDVEIVFYRNRIPFLRKLGLKFGNLSYFPRSVLNPNSL